jgi:DnaJ-class molecular chaperone
VSNDHEILFSGEGDLVEAAIPGDLIVKVKIVDDNQFIRQSNDLLYNLPVSFLEALKGFERVITHLDGRKVPISKMGTSQFNEIIQIQGEGMPNQSQQRGNLLCKINFKFPEVLTEA